MQVEGCEARERERTEGRLVEHKNNEKGRRNWECAGGMQEAVRGAARSWGEGDRGAGWTEVGAVWRELRSSRHGKDSLRLGSLMKDPPGLFLTKAVTEP